MLYCQCSRRQRERRPGSSDVPKARICGMLGGLASVCRRSGKKRGGMVNSLAGKCVCVCQDCRKVVWLLIDARKMGLNGVKWGRVSEDAFVIVAQKKSTA